MGKINAKTRIEKGEKIKPLIKDDKPTNQLPPKFSFRYLSFGSQYCFSKLTKDEKIGFANKIYQLSQMTWLEIHNANRHTVGTEIIDRNSIRAELPKNITLDVTLHAIRFHKLKPMVGFKDHDGTFYILWFDPKLKLYNHG